MQYYSVTQWLFFFYFYCFVGWCFESAYVSLLKRRPVNRGFLRGPFLPLYGSGAIMMLVVSIPFQDNPVMVYIAGCIGATALEYVTGVTMEALFKVRYWDYSNQKFNFQGHICLSSTIAWGFLTILMTEVIHKPVERAVLMIPQTVLTVVVLVLTVGISADFALSFKAALDLRDVLEKLENTRQELLRIQKRLDVVIAVAGEDIGMRRAELLEDLKNSRLGELAEGWTESIKEELRELAGRYDRNQAEKNRLSSLRDFFQRDMIRSNPTMSSRKFSEALEELKKAVGRRNGRK